MTENIYDLAYFQVLAAANGGTCLGGDFSGTRPTLKFRCSLGHEWIATAKHIVYRKSWCPQCRGQHYNKHDLKTFQLIAEKRGGRCLSSEYAGIRKHLQFVCDQGHEWRAQPCNILHRQSWCPVCANGRNETFKRQNALQMLKQIQNIATERGGRCLSETYLGDKVHLAFECEHGHQWNTTPNTIKRHHWCPVCK